MSISTAGLGQLDGTVTSVIFKGVHFEMSITDTTGFQWIVHSTQSQEVGETVSLSVIPFNIHIMKKSGEQL